VWTFRDGKIARYKNYQDTAAVAAAHRVEWVRIPLVMPIRLAC